MSVQTVDYAVLSLGQMVRITQDHQYAIDPITYTQVHAGMWTALYAPDGKLLRQEWGNSVATNNSMVRAFLSSLEHRFNIHFVDRLADVEWFESVGQEFPANLLDVVLLYGGA